MQKVIFLLAIVSALLILMISCTPKKSDQEQSSGTVQTTNATTEDSIPWDSNEPTGTNETEKTQPSGGLEVGEDTDEGFGELIPLG